MKNTLSDFGKQDLPKHEFCASGQSNSSAAADRYNKIKNLSQEEGSKMLFEQVKKQKQDGTFDFCKLQEQVNALQPYLSAQDFANLQKLLASLK